VIIILPTDIPVNELDASGAVLVESNVAVNDHAEWAAGTAYTIGQRVIVLGTTQRIYESLTNGNIGNFPPDSPLDWLDLGFVNRWRMFDGGTSTVTRNAESVAVKLEPQGFVNALAMFRLEASSARIIVSQNGDVVFDQTAQFILEGGESNWWSWFFGTVLGTIETPRDHVVLSIPGLFDPTIEVIFERPNGEVAIGLLIAGRQQRLGVGIYGSTVGIRDFSTKELDVFGNFRVVERRFAKRAEIDVYMPTRTVATVQQALADRRATPTVYIGTERACLFCPDSIHEELIIYGFYSDFDIVLNDRNNSSGTIEIEGL